MSLNLAIGDFAKATHLTEAMGDVTVFIPCVQPGSHSNIDIAYGSLATYVAKHAIALDGPLREYYVVGPLETADQAAWRTEIGWPIFQTI
jgi:hypothetical protein